MVLRACYADMGRQAHRKPDKEGSKTDSIDYEHFLRLPFQQPAMKIRTEDWEKVSPVGSLIFIGGAKPAS